MLSCPKDTERAVSGPVLPSQEGRREEIVMGEAISFDPHRKREKKKLDYLGMENWAESYRTQNKLKRKHELKK